ncbi:hypothetical protein ACIQ7D_04435 [Streptomyces sp. NPDC096310]|uniref:hypothetical protein n=1 Tax=Streptomyces sp. NPDC096310 TaxID=3366082 RepID=UPI003812C509
MAQLLRILLALNPSRNMTVTPFVIRLERFNSLITGAFGCFVDHIGLGDVSETRDAPAVQFSPLQISRRGLVWSAVRNRKTDGGEDTRAK